MKILIKMALRNLRRNTRRTLLTMSSIAFGLAVILWLECVLEGRNKSMIDQITSTRTGHLQLHRSDYLSDRAMQQTFQLPTETLESTLPPGAHFAPRMFLPSMISSGEQSTTINLIGIEPAQEILVTNIKDSLHDGEFLVTETDAACPTRQIYVGQALADLLKVKVGNKLVLMTQAADNTLGNDLFRVKGIFKTGSGDFDKTVAYAPLPCVTKLGVLNGVHELAIKLPETDNVMLVSGRLTSKIDPTLKVSTWQDAMPSLAAVLKFNQAVVGMISTILFIVISLGIINVLLIGIFERTREFGVMIALGTTPFQLKGVVLLESLFLAVGASILGTIIGSAMVYYHMHVGFDMRPFLGQKGTVIDQFSLEYMIYPIFRILPYVKSVGATLIFVLLASVYPAFRASRLKPVEAMRAV